MLQQLIDLSPKKKGLRSAIPEFDFKEKCLFCGEDGNVQTEKKKIPNKRDIQDVRSFRPQDTIFLHLDTVNMSLLMGVIFSFVRDHLQNSVTSSWATTALVARRCPFPLNREQAQKGPLGQVIHVSIF